jgi:integrase/recombinase XerD
MKEPLDPWIEGYLDYQLKVRRLRPRSIIDMRCTLKRAAAELGALRPSIALWKLTLQDYLQWLNQQREGGYSIQSLNKELSHLRGLLDYTWRSGRADRNVLDGLTLADMPAPAVPRCLTLEQARQLIEASGGSTRQQRRDRLILLLLYGCGLRTSELCQLNLDDVDRERQELRIRNGKGDRARNIPVPEAVWTQLLAYLAERKGKRGPLLRTWNKHARLGASDVCQVVAVAGKLAGLPTAITPKVLRHSFATHLMDRGIDVAVIASLMGHRSATETGVYLHRVPGRAEAAVQLLTAKSDSKP